MKRKGEVLQVIKQFTKEIGAPDAIVSNMAKEQLSQEVKHFCNQIGTTMSLRGGNATVQSSRTLHQVDERSRLQRYVGDGLTDGSVVGTGPPVGVGIGSLLVTPEINGEIGAMSAESDLVGIENTNTTNHAMVRMNNQGHSEKNARNTQKISSR